MSWKTKDKKNKKTKNKNKKQKQKNKELKLVGPTLLSYLNNLSCALTDVQTILLPQGFYKGCDTTDNLPFQR